MMRGIRGSVVFVCVVLVAALAYVGCTKPNPAYCNDSAHDCGPDRHCNTTSSPGKNTCVPNDGGADGSEVGLGDGGDASEAGDASDDVLTGCNEINPCSGDGGARVCDVDAGRICVGCLERTDCTDPASPACDKSTKTCVECLATTTPALDPDCKDGKKPICQAQKCRACKTDTECPDPGICMPDGHCAAAAAVVFVENKAGGCGASPDGTSAMPYCLPTDGANAMTSVRNVLVIRGPVDGKLTLSTSSFAPVVVGKKVGSEEPTITAGAGPGVTVSSGDVLIRDVAVIGGSSMSMTKGIVVSGSSTKLQLVNVTVALGTGLGVQAGGGATLSMDRCVVQKNSEGGIQINGATYDIRNTGVSGNKFGIQFAGTISNQSNFS